MIENWLDSLSSMIGQTPWLAPLLALFAGVLTSVTPCALSNAQRHGAALHLPGE